MYVFMGTWRTSGGGLGAGIKVFDKETLIEKIKSSKGKSWMHQLRYAKVNEGYSELVSLMSLAEFDEIFDPRIFTTEEITKYFRKEVSEKYGEHAERKKLKRIPKKELKIGRCYQTDTGDEYFYFGKCKGSFYEPEFKSSYWHGTTPKKNEEFDGYVYSRNNKQGNIEDIFISKFDYEDKQTTRVHKPYYINSLKKFVKELNHKIEVSKSFEYKDTTGRILKIEFLDIK